MIIEAKLQRKETKTVHPEPQLLIKVLQRKETKTLMGLDELKKRGLGCNAKKLKPTTQLPWPSS